MLGIKARAEGTGPPSLAVVYIELALWMATFLDFLVAELSLVVRQDWLRSLLAVSATGLFSIGLVLIKPPIWVDALITVGSLVGLWWLYRPVTRKAMPDTVKHALEEAS